jgi:hypothetical protein
MWRHRPASRQYQPDPGETVRAPTPTPERQDHCREPTIPTAPRRLHLLGYVAGSIEDDGRLMKTSPRHYDSTETVPAGWTLKGIEFDDSDSAVDGTIGAANRGRRR